MLLLQAKTCVKFNLNDLNWKELFDGPLPKFSASPYKKARNCKLLDKYSIHFLFVSFPQVIKLLFCYFQQLLAVRTKKRRRGIGKCRGSSVPRHSSKPRRSWNVLRATRSDASAEKSSARCRRSCWRKVSKDWPAEKVVQDLWLIESLITFSGRTSQDEQDDNGGARGVSRAATSREDRRKRGKKTGAEKTARVGNPQEERRVEEGERRFLHVTSHVQNRMFLHVRRFCRLKKTSARKSKKSDYC